MGMGIPSSQSRMGIFLSPCPFSNGAGRCWFPRQSLSMLRHTICAEQLTPPRAGTFHETAEFHQDVTQGSERPDFSSSTINQALVHQLHRCELFEGGHDIVPVGGRGTGETHIATTLGIHAIEHHRKKAWFFGTVDLVNALARETGQISQRSGEIGGEAPATSKILRDAAHCWTIESFCNAHAHNRGTSDGEPIEKEMIYAKAAQNCRCSCHPGLHECIGQCAEGCGMDRPGGA
jgi:hypothetical protein